MGERKKKEKKKRILETLELHQLKNRVHYIVVGGREEEEGEKKDLRNSGIIVVVVVWMISPTKIIGVGVKIILLLLRSEWLSRLHGGTNHMKLIKMLVWIFTCKTMKP